MLPVQRQQDDDNKPKRVPTTNEEGGTATPTTERALFNPTCAPAVDNQNKRAVMTKRDSSSDLVIPSARPLPTMGFVD